MAKPVVEINSKGAKALLNSPEVRRELRKQAERVAQRARTGVTARTGNYAAGIKVVDDTTDRAVVRVAATAPHSHLVEAKTGNLARALGSAGG